ncbi:hypothetical protein SDC9_45838 [bioreactor metagenome]|uniref:Uncharacterized protein n=1 Tax=bioreactor metagenome TaxID=1076179 RepID=A0A644W818_9ZZZZ
MFYGGKKNEIDVCPEAGGEIGDLGTGDQRAHIRLRGGKIVQTIFDAEHPAVHWAVAVGGEIKAECSNAMLRQRFRNCLGGGALLAAAEAVADDDGQLLMTVYLADAGNIVPVSAGDGLFFHCSPPLFRERLTAGTPVNRTAEIGGFLYD